MRLEDVRVAIRPRTPWEAVDLGFTMARAWGPAVWAPFLVLVAALFGLLSLAFSGAPHGVLLALWWLKPLFDRVLLHVLSRAVFGAPPTLRETLGALPGLLGHGLWLQLTLLRLDAIRSFRLPVLQLERLTGRARRERVAVLSRRGRSHAVGLTFVCLHLELVLGVAVLALIALLVPAGVDFDGWARVAAAEGWEALAWNGLLVLPFCVLEPFYVAGGFALYLSRRAELEGWDLELRLRRIARRLAAGGTVTGALGALLVAAGLALAPAPPALAAVEDEPLAAAPLDPRESPRVVAEVLAHEDFATTRTHTTWRWRGAEDAAAAEFPSWLDPLARATGALARVLEVLGWAALALFAGWLLWHARGWAGGGWRLPRAGRRSPAATVVAGLDLRPEALPTDVVAAARGHRRRGAPREALSLLYRGCLSRLMLRFRLEIGAAATEGEVVRAARGRLPPAEQGYLERTTALWQAQAYGHRTITAKDFEALVADWPLLEGER